MEKDYQYDFKATTAKWEWRLERKITNDIYFRAIKVSILRYSQEYILW